MIKDNKIVIPEVLKENMQILSTIENTVEHDLGILIMGENTDKDKYIADALSVIRIYLLRKIGSKYFVENELEAFGFHDLESAYEFVVNLPNMTALDMLIIMNNAELKLGGEMDKEDDEPILH